MKKATLGQACFGRRRGSTLVEFALVLPILLIVSLLLVQYGIILNATISISHLAREAARYAAVNPTDDNAIRARIAAIAPATTPYSQIGASNIVITPAVGQRTTGASIRVTITYNMSRKLFLPSRFFGIPVSGTNFTTFTEMRIE